MMDIGLVYALLTGCIWAGVASGYAAAARGRLAMAPFVAVAASVGAVLGGAFTLHWPANPTWGEVAPVLALIAASGAIGQSCMMLYGAAMTAAPEHSAATWTIVQTAMIIPFLAATLTGREHASLCNWLALPVILIAFRSLTPAGGESAGSSSKRRAWLGLLFAAFLLSGVSQALAQEISLRGLRDTLNLRVFVALASGGLVLWVVAVLRRQYPTSRHWLIGGLTGVVVAAGNVTLFAALDVSAAAGRAYLVFPVCVGGSILAFAACQSVMGRESWHVKKVIGLACGLAGIALLGWRR